MSLKHIAKDFAYQHRIELKEGRSDLIGSRERLVVGYFDTSRGQRLFVNKSFPPLDGIYESKVFISDDGQKPVLKMSILYGCLEDYIVQLAKVKGDLGRVVQEMLIDSYLKLREKHQLPENVLQQQLPIGIPGHEDDLHELLSSFYPYR